MAILDVIRCEQEGDWILWRWHPSDGSPQSREHGIRFGSRLFVRPAQAAVFLYKGQQGDLITGPFDGTLRTANLPVLASVIGLAFGGDTPFTAEVYYLNLRRALKMQWGVPFFLVMDKEYDIPVLIAVTGSCSLSVQDPASFAFHVAGGAASRSLKIASPNIRLQIHRRSPKLASELTWSRTHFGRLGTFKCARSCS
jgi:membrane protease subunit (stomatin/prohibitin family)